MINVILSSLWYEVFNNCDIELLKGKKLDQHDTWLVCGLVLICRKLNMKVDDVNGINFNHEGFMDALEELDNQAFDVKLDSDLVKCISELNGGKETIDGSRLRYIITKCI